MADLAKYIRIYDPAPDDDLVAKREQAVNSSVTALRKMSSVPMLIALADATARSFVDAATPDPLGEIVANAIKAKSPSFMRNERELEVSVLSGVAVIELLNGTETINANSIKDIIGAALWSALAFQDPIADGKHEELRQELLGIAQSRSLFRAEVARKRLAPKDVPEFADGDAAELAKSVAAVRNALTTLENNALLDREEIDILWWANGGRSPTLERLYSELDPAASGLVRGVELGILSRRLPSRSMRSLALAKVPQTPEMTLAELIATCHDVVGPLAAKIPAAGTVQAHPAVFPLLSAITANRADAGGRARTADDWCGRAVLETGLASVCEAPNPRL